MKCVCMKQGLQMLVFLIKTKSVMFEHAFCQCAFLTVSAFLEIQFPVNKTLDDGS